MKHIKIAIVLFFVTVTLFQSCKKDQGPTFFYATIEQYNNEDKVHIEGTTYPYSCWDDGDKIRMNALLGTVSGFNGSYTIQLSGNIDHYGSDGHTSSRNPIAAIYPASLFDAVFSAWGANNVYLPPTQYYSEVSGHQRLIAPMLAYAPARTDGPLGEDNTADTLSFRNVCSLIKVKVKTSTPISITRIEIENTGANRTTTRPLWGNFIADVSASTATRIIATLQEPTYWNPNSDPFYKHIVTKVALDMTKDNPNGKSIGVGTTPFYIYVPAVGYDNLAITIYAIDGTTTRYHTTTSIKNGTFVANTIYPITIQYGSDWTVYHHQPDVLSGVFTVASGKTVNFTRGNIQHAGSSYAIAEHQFDFNGYYGNLDYGTRDLFTMSEVSTVLSNFSEYVLLTGEEWAYLLGNTSGAESGAHRSDDYRFVPAMVSNTSGIIIFPDGFSSISGLTGINSIQTSYVSNTLTLEQWYALETVGCVFIPCVAWTNMQTDNIKNQGYYWNGNNYGSTSDRAWTDLSLGNNLDTDEQGIASGDGTTNAYIRLVQVVSNTK